MDETISFFLTLLMQSFNIPGISFPPIGVIKIIPRADHGLGLNEIIMIDVKKMIWLLYYYKFYSRAFNSMLLKLLT